MTPSGLKHLYETNNKDGHFFSRENMKFSGDTMRNFAVSQQMVTDSLHEGEDKRPDLKAWCLYRKHTVKTHIGYILSPAGFVKAFDAKGNILRGYRPL